MDGAGNGLGLIESLLTAYGPQGIAFAILLYVVKTLYERNSKLTDELMRVTTEQATAQANTANSLIRLADLLRVKAGD